MRKLLVMSLCVFICCSCEAKQEEIPPVIEKNEVVGPKEEVPIEEIPEPLVRATPIRIEEDEYVRVTSYPVDLQIDSYDGWEAAGISKTVDMIELKLNSDEALLFNEQMQKETDQWLLETTYFDSGENTGHWHTTAMKGITYSIYDDILSITSKINRFLFSAGNANTIYEVANFELSTGKRLSNEALLRKLNKNSDELQTELLTLLNDNYIACPALAKNEIEPCYEEKGSQIDEESLLFLDELGNYKIIVDIVSAMKDPKEILTLTQ